MNSELIPSPSRVVLLVGRCQQTATGDPGSVVSGTAVTTSGRIEWQVLAHEIGHNFGAIVSALLGLFALHALILCVHSMM